jgi:hypothetical protein
LARRKPALVRRHGKDAAIFAAQRTDGLLAAGEMESEIVWKRIVGAVNDGCGPIRGRQALPPRPAAPVLGGARRLSIQSGII